MESIVKYLETCWERMQNPELLFGLMVRFFGVFIVLIIVMIGIWIVGRIIAWVEKPAGRRSEAPPAERPSPGGTPQAASESSGAGQQADPVPDEIAAVIALSLASVAQSSVVHPAGASAGPLH